MAHTLTNNGNSVTVFGYHAPVYVRTDKNGTKIYHDVNCPRCGGAGRSDTWWQTGFECYDCGGTGRRPKPLEIKVYTQEYADKLEARRAAKAAAEATANAVNALDEDELRQRVDEARRNSWESEGFNRDGTGYLYTGNTYRIRQRLKDRGGRWCAFLARWIAPVDLGPIQGVTIERVNAADLCDIYGNIDSEKCWRKYYAPD